MQPSISNQIEISNPRSVVTKYVTNKCGKFHLRYDAPLQEHNIMIIYAFPLLSGSCFQALQVLAFSATVASVWFI